MPGFEDQSNPTSERRNTMVRIKTLGQTSLVAIAVAAIVGIGASSASAACIYKGNPCETLRVVYPPPQPEEELHPGDSLQWETNNAVLVAKGGLQVSCGDVKLNGALNGNNLKFDVFTLSGDVFTDCVTNGGAPASITLNTGPNGLSGNFGVNGKSQLNGPVMFTAQIGGGPAGGGMTCIWSASKVKSSDNINGQPIVVQ